MIQIVLSTDARGLANNATLIGSVLRRTALPVRVRVYTRGFDYSSFSSGRLTVDFIRSEEAVSGRYPRHVPGAVFDRLRIIADEREWDRVLVLDHDMVVLCDLAPYFAEDFEGNLLMGRLFGPRNTLGLQMHRRGGLPEHLRHCDDYPYFFMGPMMNLKAMRDEGTWETLLSVHEAIGQDEQISLTAATGGKVKGVSKMWNLVPQWDKLEAHSAVVKAQGESVCEQAGVRWVNGVPEGIIHWTGGGKPWHYRSQVWRPDLWEAEKTSWEHLLDGTWEKPRGIEVEPEDSRSVHALLKRGWKVRVVGMNLTSNSKLPAFPDLETKGEARSLAEADAEGADLVRIGSRSCIHEWITAEAGLPDRLVIRGPRKVEDIEYLRQLGYSSEARIDRSVWPAGGPHPDVVDYREFPVALAVAETDELYLSRQPAPAMDREPIPSDPESADVGKPEAGEGLEDWLAQDLRANTAGVVLELGGGHQSRLISRALPSSRIISIVHRAWQFSELHRAGVSNVEPHHAPVNSTLPWLDLRELDPVLLDLLVVDRPREADEVDLREGSLSLARWLKPASRVAISVADESQVAGIGEPWIKAGFELLGQYGDWLILGRNGAADVAEACGSSKVSSRVFPCDAYLIGEREREGQSSTAVTVPAGVAQIEHLVPGLLTSRIHWDEMKGLEAHGCLENLRGDYVENVVCERRAVVSALRAFLASGEPTALVCLPGCRWNPDAARLLARAVAELPDDWDLLYLQASAREPHRPFSPHLVRVMGARGGVAVLWKREAAARLLPELESCDCELDVFLHRQHEALAAFCVAPMPVYFER
jgi:lipopolysaccharide biosynthesis glycosyltransferase